MESMDTDLNLERGIRCQQVLRVEAWNSRIINSLNEDCWNLILNKLTVKELLQTEWTCKDWQRQVLEHLAYRTIAIYTHYIDENTLILRTSSKAWVSFKRWMKKCGLSIHDFDVDCQHFKDVVEVLRDYCPNLIGLTLRRLKKKLPPTNKLYFQRLIWLNLEWCDEVTDDCISQFLTSSLVELAIAYNKRVTGRFLNNLNPDNDVRCLTLNHCRAFKLSFLLSATDRLQNLTNLELCKRNRSKVEIRNQLHLLLDRFPSLQDICFEVYDLLSCNVDSLAESNAFFESVYRLERLHRLKANFQVWDHHLEAIAISCKEITDLELMCNPMTRSGLDALCRHAGPRLYQLNLSGGQITEDDVVACVYACYNLLYLELCDCLMLDYASVMRRIAVARRYMRRSVPPSKRFHSLRWRLQLAISTDDSWDFYGAINDIEDVIDVRFLSDFHSIDRLY